MTDTRNRSQRREDRRRAIKNWKESMRDRARIDRRMARQQDAQDTNRARALRAVGVTDEIEPGLLSLSVFKKRRIDVWQGLVLTLLLLTMVMLGGVYWEDDSCSEAARAVCVECGRRSDDLWGKLVWYHLGGSPRCYGFRAFRACWRLLVCSNHGRWLS